MVEMGIPLTRSLDVVEQLRKHAEGIAKLYVELFLNQVWRPFDDSGRPPEQWPHLYETLERLRAVSGEAILAVLQLAVSERLDLTFGRDIMRNVRTGPAEREPANTANSDQTHPA
jgi:hypothetical protein